MARATNDGFEIPLADGEVSDIAKSIERYRRTWITEGRFWGSLSSQPYMRPWDAGGRFQIG